MEVIRIKVQQEIADVVLWVFSLACGENMTL